MGRAVSGGAASVPQMESGGDRLAAVKDPQIAERGQAAAALREPTPADPAALIDVDDQDDSEEFSPSLRLVDPARACVETNLTRRGSG